MSKVTELLEALMLSFASPFGYDNGVDDGLDAGLDDVDDSIEVVEHGASDEEASEGLTIIKAEQMQVPSLTLGNITTMHSHGQHAFGAPPKRNRSVPNPPAAPQPPLARASVA